MTKSVHCFQMSQRDPCAPGLSGIRIQLSSNMGAQRDRVRITYSATRSTTILKVEIDTFREYSLELYSPPQWILRNWSFLQKAEFPALGIELFAHSHAQRHRLIFAPGKTRTPDQRYLGS